MENLLTSVYSFKISKLHILQFKASKSVRCLYWHDYDFMGYWIYINIFLTLIQFLYQIHCKNKHGSYKRISTYMINIHSIFIEFMCKYNEELHINNISHLGNIDIYRYLILNRIRNEQWKLMYCQMITCLIIHITYWSLKYDALKICILSV